MSYSSNPLPTVALETQVQLTGATNDSIIILSNSTISELPDLYTELAKVDKLKTWGKKDAKMATEISVLFTDDESKPIVLSPLGKLEREYDDVRTYAEAASKAVKRLKGCGTEYKAPLILVEPPKNKKITEPGRYINFLEVTMLAVLAELDECIEVREAGKQTGGFESIKFAVLGTEGFNLVNDKVVEQVLAIEAGRRLARDIGGSDPERMTPLKCAAAVEEHFKGASNVNVEVIRDLDVLGKEYPLYMAVARASLYVPRQHPCVVKLEYKAPDQSKVEEELFLIGKGVTFDTGGADVKVGGHMVGMSRDKCGAAGVAGFMATVSRLAPSHLNVTVELAFVRNSIGADSYVCDEIIKSRAGVRVRVGNTDAEGRMAMADLLAEVKEKALKLADPSKARLFTCATLTGHAVRTYGPYGAAMDNGPAKRACVGPRLKDAGDLLADPFELSTIRREDYSFVASSSPREDVLQAGNQPSVATSRGHQYPFAFMAIASGLDKHGNDSELPVSYTHLDIAGSAEESGIGTLGRPTGCPIAALSGSFLFNKK